MTENIKCPCCGSEDICDLDEWTGGIDTICLNCTCEWPESKRQPPDAWIACSERLPEEGVDVIAYDRSGDVYVDCINYIELGLPFWNWFGFGVTHWQPLPQPPETGKAGE